MHIKSRSCSNPGITCPSFLSADTTPSSITLDTPVLQLYKNYHHDPLIFPLKMKRILVLVTALGVCWYAYAVSPSASSSSVPSSASGPDGKGQPAKNHPLPPPNLNFEAFMEQMKANGTSREEIGANIFIDCGKVQVDWWWWNCLQCFWGYGWCCLYNQYGYPMLFGPCWILKLIYGCFRPFFWWWWGYHTCYIPLPQCSADGVCYDVDAEPF